MANGPYKFKYQDDFKLSQSVNGYTKVQNFCWVSYSQALMSTPELKSKCHHHLLTIKMVVHIKLPRTNRQEESSVTC